MNKIGYADRTVTPSDRIAKAMGVDQYSHSLEYLYSDMQKTNNNIIRHSFYGKIIWQFCLIIKSWETK